eukprot:1161874-Rhodomonas_salina.2
MALRGQGLGAYAADAAPYEDAWHEKAAGDWSAESDCEEEEERDDSEQQACGAERRHCRAPHRTLSQYCTRCAPYALSVLHSVCSIRSLSTAHRRPCAVSALHTLGTSKAVACA